MSGARWQFAQAFVSVVLGACSIETSGLAARASLDAGREATDAERGGGDARLPVRTDAGRDAGGEEDAGRYETHLRECESGALVGAATAGSDAAASEGAYTHAPSAAEWSPDSTSLPPDRVELSFTLGRSGPWYLWVRLYTLDGTHDAQYAGFDAGDLRRFWHLDHGTWAWTRGTHDDDTRLTFSSLEPGEHVLAIGPGETGPRCDVVALTTDPDFDPSSVR